VLFYEKRGERGEREKCFSQRRKFSLHVPHAIVVVVVVVAVGGGGGDVDAQMNFSIGVVTYVGW
jgi:hypothetical protein